MRYLRLTPILALVSILLALVGCPGFGDGGNTGRNSVTDAAGVTTAGFDYAKNSPGLPTRTLDYITLEPVALAGARQAGIVFFGVENADEGITRIYSRDLETYERRLIAKAKNYVNGSLTASQDGRYLAYARWRETEKYIDDPFCQFPKRVAIPYRLEVATGKVEELFDFRKEAWLPYRNDRHTLFISTDGARVISLAYNLDRLALARQLADWLAIDADYQDRYEEMGSADRSVAEEKLPQLLTARHVEPLLQKLGVSPTPGAMPGEEEREAMKALFQDVSSPQAALLIWEDGQSKILPLGISEDREHLIHYVLASNKHTVLLVAPDAARDNTMAEPVYTVDQTTGEVSECFSYLGVPSFTELSSDEQSLVMVVNAVDAEAREIVPESKLHRIPLDGSESTQVPLGGDYLGFVNCTTDATHVVGQDRDDLNLYLTDVASGERMILKEMMAEISSVFVADAGGHVVFSDSGVLFQIDTPLAGGAEITPLDDTYVSAYVAYVVGFLEQLGYEVPSDLEYEWEERQGLGQHEVAFALHNPAEPKGTALVRYKVEPAGVASLWFPAAQPFPIVDQELQGQDLDYYEVEELAVRNLDRVGWLNPETRTLFQPGGNPLYDGRTNSYVVTYRDGYWLGEGDDAQWVYNGEASIRIHANDGSIAEMTLVAHDPVHGQSLSVPLDTAVFKIRNEGTNPIPEEAPVRFDSDNYRLIVYEARLEQVTDAGYEMALVNRLCYEIDGLILPEDALIITGLVDTETGKMYGQIDYQPEGVTNF